MKMHWRLAPATDESKFPRGWHLVADGAILGSVCGEYAPVEPAAGDVCFALWRWRLPNGRTGCAYKCEEEAKAALEARLAPCAPSG